MTLPASMPVLSTAVKKKRQKEEKILTLLYLYAISLGEFSQVAPADIDFSGKRRTKMKDRLNRSMSLLVVLLTVLFINAGTNPPSPIYTPAVMPQPPSIIRNVSLVQAEQYQYPYAPAFRTSADGRVALSVRELGAGGEISFYSFVPEAINQQTPAKPFRLSNIITPPMIFPSTSVVQQVPDSELGILSGYSPQHHTICDPTVQDLQNPPASPNPYVCNGSDDCYTLWIISPTTNGSNLVLNSAEVVVEVVKPKTAGAYLKPVTVVSTTNAPPIPIQNPNDASESNLLEPMITTDGNLLVGRIQGSTLTWKNNSGTPATGLYSIVYSVGSSGNPAPCDVRQWSSFYPIAHAYNDSNMNGGKYGLADYQLRDPENNLIAETADVEGTYPWIDRMGRNLFFTHVAAMLFNPNGGSSTGVQARYSDGCVVKGCTDPLLTGNPADQIPISNLEESTNTRGLTVAGRWTHGKMVQLDGLMNNIDYGLHVPDPEQRNITLYSSGSPIQFGSGRYNSTDGNPSGYAENTTITDSFENIFNYLATLKPITLREVTWQVNMGKGGDEIPFDDYINPEAFIVSDMTASTSWTSYNYPSSSNGFSSSASPLPAEYNDGFKVANGFTSSIHLQNAATTVSSQWNIPAYGLVMGSAGNTTGMTARVEPAALGGIKGKGFWLQDGNYVSYSIPTQPPSKSVINTPWFISLFVDSRCCTASGDTTPRRILTFPDGSYVNIVGSSQLVLGYLSNGQKKTITGNLPGPLNLPIPQGWWHLAFQVAQGGQSVAVYVNGFLWTTVQPQAPVFQIVPQSGCPAQGCQLTMGGDPITTDNATGFNGWVDEFKVIAQNVDYETVCNHAHGTIVGANSTWGTVSDYPQSSNTVSEGYAINQFLNNLERGYPTFNDYGCVVNYSSDTNAIYLPVFGVTPGNLPSSLPTGATLMRDYLHFPEGQNAQLVWDQPRPSSTGNNFCGSCHVDNGGQASQTLSNGFALAAGAPGSEMSTDPRRQPTHPQRLVYGNVPAGYFNGQQPASGKSSTSGIPLDQWVFPDPPRNPPNP
jgi:hypothetical protein